MKNFFILFYDSSLKRTQKAGSVVPCLPINALVSTSVQKIEREVVEGEKERERKRGKEGRKKTG